MDNPHTHRFTYIASHESYVSSSWGALYGLRFTWEMAVGTRGIGYQRYDLYSVTEGQEMLSMAFGFRQ